MAPRKWEQEAKEAREILKIAVDEICEAITDGRHAFLDAYVQQRLEHARDRLTHEILDPLYRDRLVEDGLDHLT